MKQADAEPAEAENVVTFPTPVRMKNPAAVALGKLGGSKGGQKRAENLSPEPTEGNRPTGCTGPLGEGEEGNAGRGRYLYRGR